MDPQSLKPLIISPLAGFVILTHSPTPKRPVFLSLTMIVTFVGHEDEFDNSINGRFEVLDPNGQITFESPYGTGQGVKSKGFMSNKENIAASIAHIEFRNFSFTHPGEYVFRTYYPGGNFDANLSAIIAEEE